jgi:hypothetical protein
MIVPGSSIFPHGDADYFRRHLLAVAGNIESHWPASTRGPLRFLGRGGLSGKQEQAIRVVLESLPMLTVDDNGSPMIFAQADSDLSEAIGLVIDAGFALIQDENLSRPYDRPVMVMKPGPDGEPALDTLEAPTAGDLLSRLLLGLQGIEGILIPPQKSAKPSPMATQENVERKTGGWRA